MLQKTKKCLLLVVLLANITHEVKAFTSNTRYGYDAYPMYSTLDPHEFMFRKERQWLKGLCQDLKYQDEQEQLSREDCTQRVRFAISPFAQFSDRGRNIHNDEEYLGDLGGRWNMIALLFGNTPQGKNLPMSLETAKDNLFGQNIGVVSNPELYIDPQRQFGFFSVPLKYRKYGVRFEFDVRLARDIGFCLQFGFACICQRLEDICRYYDICSGVSCIGQEPCKSTDITKADVICETPNCSHRSYMLPIDLTECSNTNPLPSAVPANSGITQLENTDVQFYLMNQLHAIAKDLGLDICNFNKGSVEDVRFNLYWRHAIEINEDADKQHWAHFLFIPFLEACFTAGVADCLDTSVMLSAPFGNNGHHSIGVNGGFLVDFTETVELGFEAGVTHFFSKSFSCYRVPNSIHQSGIYPFTTSVTVCPGLNCHLSLKLASFHFLSKLSTYFQYIMVMHKDDQICLCKPDPAFKPCVLERHSCWKTHLANIGFNYDISPNVTLGFLWQAPLSQKRAVRASTVMASINFAY